MDFKKFGTVVLIFGIVVLAYGGFQWVSNQPKKFNQAESGQSIFGGRDDLGNMLNVQLTNMRRAEKRENAIKIVLAGAIVAFAGLGISYSAKKEDNSPSHKTELDSPAQDALRADHRQWNGKMLAFLRSLSTRVVWLRLLLLGLAVLAGFILARELYDKGTTPVALPEARRFFTVPVQVRAPAADLRSFEVNPSVIEVKVGGEQRRVERLQAADIRAVVDVTGLETAPDGLRKRIGVTAPAGITVMNVIPGEANVIVPPKR